MCADRQFSASSSSSCNSPRAHTFSSWSPHPNETLSLSLPSPVCGGGDPLEEAVLEKICFDKKGGGGGLLLRNEATAAAISLGMVANSLLQLTIRVFGNYTVFGGGGGINSILSLAMCEQQYECLCVCACAWCVLHQGREQCNTVQVQQIYAY